MSHSEEMRTTSEVTTMISSSPSSGSESSSPMSSPTTFTPKPFPPPALKDIPESYIVSQLHRLASHYWDRPETADCTLIIPCDVNTKAVPSPPTSDPLTTGPFANTISKHSRRENEPLGNARRMVLKLHQQYLSAQSAFIRALFSGSSPVGINAALIGSVSLPATPLTATFPQCSLAPDPPISHLAPGAFPLHPSRRPRILPSSRVNHPVVFLPVPDSVSIPHLIHFLYFGSFDYMEDCLHRGVVTWHGIVRNVEYLGLRVELKAALGRYYRRWLKPNALGAVEINSLPLDESDDEEEDDEHETPELSTKADTSEGEDEIHFATLPPKPVTPPLP
ncbi:hypothetical protein BU17DRAFT_91766 [Hysterangium stoloniferum]|nr:hypothetical protein BU17DRAFT_91766 [Hysterangium stoloniferum]